MYDIIKDARLIFNLDGEDFCYKIDEEFIKINNIEELINLKNKINIPPKNKVKENGDKKDEKNEDRKKIKRKIFLKLNVIN